MKKLGYNKYYEHIPFIKDQIGIKPPLMTPELEETLCNLFTEIQEPYAKFRLMPLFAVRKKRFQSHHRHGRLQS